MKKHIYSHTTMINPMRYFSSHALQQTTRFFSTKVTPTPSLPLTTSTSTSTSTSTTTSTSTPTTTTSSPINNSIHTMPTNIQKQYQLYKEYQEYSNRKTKASSTKVSRSQDIMRHCLATQISLEQQSQQSQQIQQSLPTQSTQTMLSTQPILSTLTTTVNPRSIHSISNIISDTSTSKSSSSSSLSSSPSPSPSLLYTTNRGIVLNTATRRSSPFTTTSPKHSPPPPLPLASLSTHPVQSLSSTTANSFQHHITDYPLLDQSQIPLFVQELFMTDLLQQESQDLLAGLSEIPTIANSTYSSLPLDFVLELSPFDLTAMEQLASKQITSFTPRQLFQFGHRPDFRNVISSARFLHNELAIRFAQLAVFCKSIPTRSYPYYSPMLEGLVSHFETTFLLLWQMKAPETIIDAEECTALFQYVLRRSNRLNSTFSSYILSRAMLIRNSVHPLMQSYSPTPVSAVISAAIEASAASPTPAPAPPSTSPSSSASTSIGDSTHNNSINDSSNDNTTTTTNTDSTIPPGITDLLHMMEDPAEMYVVQEALDNFHISRIETRLLLAQHVALHQALLGKILYEDELKKQGKHTTPTLTSLSMDIPVDIVPTDHSSEIISAIHRKFPDFKLLKPYRPNFAGLIALECQPLKVAEQAYRRAIVRTLSRLDPNVKGTESLRVVQELAESKMHIPKLQFRGDKDLTLRFIQPHLLYILTEILTNSVSALVNRYPKHGTEMPPPIEVTISRSNTDFYIRISDFGGGIPRTLLEPIWTYTYSMNKWMMHPLTREIMALEHQEEERILKERIESDSFMTEGIPSTTPSSPNTPITEYSRTSGKTLAERNLNAQHTSIFEKILDIPEMSGVGLPKARLVARYLGGDITIMSLHGLGLDTYVTLSKEGVVTQNDSPVVDTSINCIPTEHTL